MRFARSFMLGTHAGRMDLNFYDSLWRKLSTTRRETNKEYLRCHCPACNKERIILLGNYYLKNIGF